MASAALRIVMDASCVRTTKRKGGSSIVLCVPKVTPLNGLVSCVRTTKRDFVVPFAFCIA